jgi:Tfp pilus assembly protein PilO
MRPMNEKKPKSDLKLVILNQIRQPLKLRLLLCSAIITGWYILFFSPLSEETTAATAQIVTERKRVATARQIEQLKKAMAPYKGRVHAGTDIHELMQHVIAHMRTSSLKLLDLKPDKPKDLGPYETLGLKLTLEGHFAGVDEFLKWVETDQRLLRIESIKLDPVAKSPGQLAAQVVLLSLGEKSAPIEKAKSEATKKQTGTVKKGTGKPATVKARTEAVRKHDELVRQNKGAQAAVKAQPEVTTKP